MLTIMFFAYRTAYRSTACLLAVLLSTGNISAAWQAPLNSHELEDISIQALRSHHPTKRSTTKSKSDSMLGIEILMVELQEKKSRKSGDARIAEVFIFDYATNSASVQLLNVDTHELVSTRAINHIHLPLNKREQAVATKILLDDADLIKALSDEYAAQFGKQLTSLAQVDMKVSIWEPGPADKDQSICNQTRCALVSVFTHDFYNFSIEPIVELQSAKVHLDVIQ